MMGKSFLKGGGPSPISMLQAGQRTLTISRVTAMKASPSSCVCRYLQDLPQGLSTFNDTCIAQQKDHPMVHQNKEHVRSIVQVRPMSFVRTPSQHLPERCMVTGYLSITCLCSSSYLLHANQQACFQYHLSVL